MAMHMQSIQRKKMEALEKRLKDPNDPLTKSLRASGPEHLREGYVPPRPAPAPEKKVQQPAPQERRNDGFSLDHDGGFEFD